MFISSCQPGQKVQHWVCQPLVGGVHTRQGSAAIFFIRRTRRIYDHNDVRGDATPLQVPVVGAEVRKTQIRERITSGLGSPRSGAIGKPVKTEVIVKGEPKNPGQGDDREERWRRDPAGFDLAERLDRDASCRRHFPQACWPACITQKGTEASTAFDLPGLQRISNHARMIIPV
jgi:hypothetical protein